MPRRVLDLFPCWRGLGDGLWRAAMWKMVLFFLTWVMPRRVLDLLWWKEMNENLKTVRG